MNNSILKRKLRLKIGNKIFGGFLILIILFVANALLIFQRGNKIDSAVNYSFESAKPSKEAIGEFSLMVTQSKMLITNWVYLQTNNEDKNSFREITEHAYHIVKELSQRL